jgi:cytochrome P450 family 709
MQVLAKSAVALAVGQEVLRCQPPTAGVFRRAVCDTSIGDLAVPEGTIVFMNYTDTIRSSGSASFDPAQWLSDDRRTAAMNESPCNITFSLGPRSCTGRNLAMVEIVTLMAVLAREVAAIHMSPDEMNRAFNALLPHPTGMPVRLVARKRTRAAV